VADTGVFASPLSEAPAGGLAAASPVTASTPVEIPTSQTNGSELFSPIDDGESLFTTDTSHHLNSAASMATEILSASPDIPTVGVPEDAESEIISKDVTLIARGRKRRFRLH
jgi:hypothetical protein